METSYNINDQMYIRLAQQAMMMYNQMPQQTAPPEIQHPYPVPSSSSQQPQQQPTPQIEVKPQTQVVVHTFLGANEIALLIREFNPDKNKDLFAAEWIREIELLGHLHKWNSYQLLLYASMRLKGVARTWYQHSLEYISDWDDFKLELLNNFPQSVDESSVTARLEANRRRCHDTLEEYFYSMVKLGKSIKLSDKEIQEYLTKGLDGLKKRIILSALEPCSLGEFLQHMQRLEGDKDDSGEDQKKKSTLEKESVPRRHFSPPISRDRRDRSEKRDSYDIQRKTSSWYPESKTRAQRASPASPRPGDKRPQKAANNPNTVKKVKPCYLCQETTHMIAKCPVRLAKMTKQDSNTKQKGQCYICRSRGHLAKSCPQSKVDKVNDDPRPTVKVEPSKAEYDPSSDTEAKEALAQYEVEHSLELDVLDYEDPADDTNT
ncbi:hypothetical protein DMENIID0001_164300 [Sergentomyia squamirostris]